MGTMDEESLPYKKGGSSNTQQQFYSRGSRPQRFLLVGDRTMRSNKQQFERNCRHTLYQCSQFRRAARRSFLGMDTITSFQASTLYTTVYHKEDVKYALDPPHLVVH